ncbi:MAG TPA: hypothetical protein VN840_04415, partial [Streptosporangiaceae bacterium]|nr:hypothetical protein [Streptosporangiaceae bacterium]
DQAVGPDGRGGGDGPGGGDRSGAPDVPDERDGPESVSFDADAALRLAGHLAEIAWLAAPGDSGIAAVKRQVFSARADAATSTMATGVFLWASEEASGDA